METDPPSVGYSAAQGLILAVEGGRPKSRVRFAPAAALINELVEAKHQSQLGRALARWARYELIAIDEVGYVPLAEVGAEFLFQVTAVFGNIRSSCLRNLLLRRPPLAARCAEQPWHLFLASSEEIAAHPGQFRAVMIGQTPLTKNARRPQRDRA